MQGQFAYGQGSALGTAAHTIAEHGMADASTPVLLMVSGGSDSTALAYLACQLAHAGVLGAVGIMHLNHCLRGADADADADFVQELARALDVPCYQYRRDVGALAGAEGANVEALARRERYGAANDALGRLCHSVGVEPEQGRLFTAHTQDDRVENFYMRSIVGTGPGGLRSMRYRNGNVCRPCLDLSRDDLRDYLRRRALDADADDQVALVRDDAGALWREDATNAHTDRFRSFVRHKIVPVAASRNPALLDVLCRTMNLIADEDDMVASMAAEALETTVTWLAAAGEGTPKPEDGCQLSPAFGQLPVPLQRRVAHEVLQMVLGPDARVEAASVQAVVDAFADGAPVSGYVANIQGNLALSANKRGLRIEPMSAYRARRKR